MIRLFVSVLAIFALSSSNTSASVNIPVSQAVASLKEYHGGAGPWAAAGYRMGLRALNELGLKKHSFKIEITHRSPAEVQYSCVADGVQAITGVSVGKMNLRWEKVPVGEMVTVAKHRVSGKQIKFVVKPAFFKAMLGVPHDHLEAKAIEVLKMNDDEIFDVIDDTVR